MWIIVPWSCWKNWEPNALPMISPPKDSSDDSGQRLELSCSLTPGPLLLLYPPAVKKYLYSQGWVWRQWGPIRPSVAINAVANSHTSPAWHFLILSVGKSGFQFGTLLRGGRETSNGTEFKSWSLNKNNRAWGRRLGEVPLLMRDKCDAEFLSFSSTN